MARHSAHARAILLLVLPMDYEPRNGSSSIRPEFCISYFYFAQNACALLFTVNRFTAICMPTPHIKFWSSWKWPFIAIVQGIAIIIPLLTRWPALVKYEYNPTTNAFAMVRENMNAVLIAMISFGSVVLLFCISANTYSVYRLIKFRNNSSKNASRASSMSELSFTLISFCIFFAQLMNVSIVIFSAICTYSSNFKLAQFLSTITPFTSDIFSLGPAVYTLLVPGPIRSRIVRIARRKTINARNTGSQISAIPR
ncbi:hypothetical protein PRIPAC_88911 [Pristionchus pacificus]|uniref:Serpentine receptor class gamma n=1 Tax=Pristionchus pacificus TaxID=54126 RepID=A0A2A6CT63_PRIPA|nr:hypothetical protein PRIPAC_88911 [Pristionchus pacificus]|eukprot:PDM81414.1 G protein-coupled receptor [Pristionchus pacificus]